MVGHKTQYWCGTSDLGPTFNKILKKLINIRLNTSFDKITLCHFWNSNDIGSTRGYEYN